MQYYLSGEIGNMDEGIVEWGVDVSNTENVFAFSDLWSQSDNFFDFLGLSLSWSHFNFL